MAKGKKGGKRGGGIFRPLLFGAAIGGIAQMVAPRKIPFQAPIAGAAGAALLGGARSPMPILIGAAGGVAGATLVNMAGSGTMSASNLAFY